ncbi:hypothetical protein AVEN_111570-1 [Araneus ventricosus]|uniref:PiggyBac transposable element-derived protein domain-containing protein n=1 Tax=Araneus ventricosus TaxID=182803 RepID=A0A4Y2QNL2_ARAVE|nr:hypothetical protein AVEN_111570-1 [Araneus ventricosus]
MFVCKGCEEPGEKGADIVHSESEDEKEGAVENGTEIPPGDSTSPKRSIKWRHKINSLERFSYIDTNTSSNISTESAPLQYFMKYRPFELFTEMTTNMNMHAFQKGISFKPATKEELELFFCLYIIIGNLKYPRVNLYWDNSVEIPSFVNGMARYKFFQLGANLHLVDTMHNKDRIYKVRPIFNGVRNRYLQLPVENSVVLMNKLSHFEATLTSSNS